MDGGRTTTIRPMPVSLTSSPNSLAGAPSLEGHGAGLHETPSPPGASEERREPLCDLHVDTAHRQSVRAAFDRAAETYDGAAVVQREVCERLDAMVGPACSLSLRDQGVGSGSGGSGSVLPASEAGPVCKPARGAQGRDAGSGTHRTPALILDAGCGTGFGLPLLARRFPAARLLAADFAPAMLRRLPPGLGVALGADLECLPLPSGCVDVVWSSLALQWCKPARALAELHRVLAPGGPAWLATLGPATLHELRAAFAGIDEAEHVIPFHDLASWSAFARAAGFRIVAAEQALTWATAPTLRRLLRDIKAIGAHAVGSGRRRAPLGKAAWRSLEARYEVHRRPDGLLPATYDLVLLHLEKSR
jgi:malonyl-CoA O-methyltransferase